MKSKYSSPSVIINNNHHYIVHAMNFGLPMIMKMECKHFRLPMTQNEFQCLLKSFEWTLYFVCNNSALAIKSPINHNISVNWNLWHCGQWSLIGQKHFNELSILLSQIKHHMQINDYYSRREKIPSGTLPILKCSIKLLQMEPN